MSQIRADNITNRQGTGAPIFVNGIRVVGLTSIANIVANTGTFNGAVSIGGTLTYEDVTNVDSIGIVTARDGIDSPTNLVLRTGGSERFRIDSSGRIGIGTAPYGSTAALHVYEPTNDRTLILDSGNTNGSHIRLWRQGVVQHYIGCSAGFGQGDYEDLGIRAKDNIIFHPGDSSTERLRITTSGVKVTGGYTENIVAVSGTAVDCSTASYFTKTITGATTFTFTNVPSGVAYAFTFEVTLNGSNAITWPASVKWPADTAPTITDGKTQVFVFLTDDGGTRWRGSSLVDYTN